MVNEKRISNKFLPLIYLLCICTSHLACAMENDSPRLNSTHKQPNLNMQDVSSFPNHSSRSVSGIYATQSEPMITLTLQGNEKYSTASGVKANFSEGILKSQISQYLSDSDSDSDPICWQVKSTRRTPEHFEAPLVRSKKANKSSQHFEIKTSVKK